MTRGTARHEMPHAPWGGRLPCAFGGRAGGIGKRQKAATESRTGHSVTTHRTTARCAGARLFPAAPEPRDSVGPRSEAPPARGASNSLHTAAGRPAQQEPGDPFTQVGTAGIDSGAKSPAASRPSGARLGPRRHEYDWKLREDRPLPVAYHHDLDGTGLVPAPHLHHKPG